MKPIHLLPPAVALIIVGIWIGYTRWTLTTLEAENLQLQKHAAAIVAENSPEALFPATDRKKTATPGVTEGKWDWVAVGLMINEERLKSRYSDTHAEFDKRLAAMNTEELLAAVEEILTLDLPRQTQRDLLSILMEQLVNADPELVLRNFFGRLGRFFEYSNAWGKWMGKDLDSAMAWFDEQIAAGIMEGKSLDGRESIRNEFETILIKQLFTTNPPGAVERMESLPRNHFVHITENFSLSGIEPENQKTFADLLRRHLSEKDSIERILSGLQRFNDDFTRDEAFMERIGVTPAERSACLKKVMDNWCLDQAFVGTITIARIETLRTWMEAQSPGLAPDLPQEVIRYITRSNRQSKMSLEQVKEIAAHFQTLEGGNEILADALFRCANVNHRKNFVTALAEMLPDEQQRMKILIQLGND